MPTQYVDTGSALGNFINGITHPNTYDQNGDLIDYGFDQNNLINPESPVVNADSLGPLGGYLDDQEAWNRYLELVNQSNLYNSAQMDKLLDWNEKMRNTEVGSYMDQLAERGINPILAINGGFAGHSYSSGAMAQAYSGSSPSSSSAQITSALIGALGKMFSGIASAFTKIGMI